ncbi:hypothetical protein H5T87_06475 [bacterium]|nr:hypothetical protein [bacterium]
MSWRALIIGCILIPLNCYWVAMAEIAYYTLHATVLSLFFNAIATLLFLSLFNALLRKIGLFILSRVELLTIYIMLCIATSLCAHDMMQILMSLLGYPRWFATPENQWEMKILPLLPRWLIIKDKEALTGMFVGGSNFLPYLKYFLYPLFSWSIFALLLLWCFYCLNLIFKDQWIKAERLTFPIAQVPLELTAEKAGIYKNRYFWIAFAFSGGLDIWHGLHYFFPYLTDINTRWDIGPYIRTPPWNAIGWTPICVYPFAIGLSYFIPLDLAFSSWFFYIFWKLQLILRSAIGMEPMPGPYLSSQSSGAWLGIGFIAIWGARKHIANLLTSGKRKEFLGFIVGFFLLVIFCRLAGMSLWVAILFFIIYFLIAIAVARMRAELGPPTHDLYYAGPDWLLTSLFGTKMFGAPNLAVLSLLYWITRDYRNHPIAHELEGMKIAEEVKGINGSKLWLVYCLSGMVGFISAFFIYLHIFYSWGVGAKLQRFGVGLGAEAFNRLDKWLSSPSGMDAPAIRQFSFGLGLTFFLFFLRRLFPFFPLHPVGYATAGSWTMSWLWFSVFISWLAKSSILRHGGLKAYKNAIPFFLGLIIGEYSIGSLWSIIGIIMKKEVYGFFI